MGQFAAHFTRKYCTLERSRFDSALFHITAAHIPSMVTIAAGRLPGGRYVPPDDSDRAATLRAKNLMKLSHALIQMPFKAGADLTPCFCMQIGPRIFS
jgi:hypothetical protein